MDKFSDEELRRLKGQPENNASKSNPPQRRVKPSQGRGRPTQRTRKSPDPSVNKTVESQVQLPPAARLSKPSPAEAPPTQNNHLQKGPEIQDQHHTSESDNSLNLEQKSSGQNISQQSSVGENGSHAESDMVLDEKQIIKQQYDNVQKFQFQQKLIEEQNKKKRELLTSAILDRQKKAKQEASRLTRIQKDLSQLDQLLAIDVSIIRNKIEEASREYLDAQRRYERAEKEYIESKMDLHQKTDIKDSLTEHLHLIIHQNEVRKAKKLTELMQKLSMEDGEEVQVEGLDSEDLAKMAPSAFILGSLQSTQEKHLMMRRARSCSESDQPSTYSSPKPDSTAVKRSTSDHGEGQSEGVTGWISGLIFGKPSPETKDTITEAIYQKSPSSPEKVIVEAPISSGSPVKDIDGVKTDSMIKSEPESSNTIKNVPGIGSGNLATSTEESSKTKEQECDGKQSVSDAKESPVSNKLPIESQSAEVNASTNEKDPHKNTEVSQNEIQNVVQEVAISPLNVNTSLPVDPCDNHSTVPSLKQ